jgi:lysophospholipase L1-like esterase
MLLKIVGLGDSTTAGTPQFRSPLEAPPSGEGNHESQYASWMMKEHPDWTVLNRGINGQRSDEILDRFERDVLSEEPDYVIILAGVNDVYEGVSVDVIEKNLLEMYERAERSGIVPVAATILPYNTSSESEAANIRVLNHWMKETARNLSIPFCDTNDLVADSNNPDRLKTSPDGLHPDVSGYRAMAIGLGAVIAKNFSQTDKKSE